MKRLLTSLAIAIFAVTIMPVQALAANWAWTDVSDYVSNRTNRPIWAMAHANSGWFYTDGQNLWNGGQVYRFDGNTNVTVTSDVRNAGLDRVDDIVSDGADTVLFLQDVVRMDNQFRIVVNKNGTYYNATDVVRSMLYSDEGISSISGNKGTWYLVTTKGRVFSWYANMSAPLRVTLPSNIQSKIDSVNSQAPNHTQWMYSVHTKYQPMSVVVMDDGSWLIKVPNTYNYGTSYGSGKAPTFSTEWYKVTNNSYSLLSQLTNQQLIASTGKQVLFFDKAYTAGYSLTSYNGSEFKFTSGNGWPADITAAWTGKTWIITIGSLVGGLGTDGYKSMFEFDPAKGDAEIFQSTSQYDSTLVKTRDLFIASASDNNGKILFGGVASTISSTEPSNPLTAKLVMITEGGATTVTNTNTSSDTTVDTATGISKWEWIDPNMALSSTAQTTYHVGSWDADGIKRVDIYVNGTLKRTCELANAKGNTDCNLTIYGADYSIGTNIFVNAKITDAKDKAVWTSGLTIYRTTDTSTTTNVTTNSTSNTNSSIWTWLDPNKTSFNVDENITFYAGAWDVDGINQVIMTVNGTDIRTCNLSGATGNVQCATTVYANDYSANSTITLRARIIDKNGNTVWSEQKSIYRNGTGTNNSNSNTNSNVWTWVEPNRTTIGSDESLTFSAGAWDTDGINRVILTVNGTDVRTCTFNSVTGSVECSYQVYGKDYSANSTIALRARVIDKNGNTSWSNVQEIYRGAGTTSNNSNTSNSNATIWTWIEGNKTSIDPNESAIFNTGAWDGDGINQVVITVNGGDKKTCNFGAIKSNVECVYTVSANDYSANTNIVVRARVVDVNGNTTWSEERDIYRNAGSTSGNTNTDSSTGAISKWEWVEPSVTTLEIQKTATYHADAWSASGIKSIVVYVNGTVSKTCSFNKSVMNRDCFVTITARNYAQGSSVYMNALVTDYDGQQVWTTGKTLTITADSTSSQNNNANGWVSATTNREGGYSAGQTITISVNSDDTDGIARTEIYVNGTRTAICTNSKVCSTTVTPPTAGIYFNYAGTMVDKYGTVVTTGYKQITKK